MRAPDAFFVHTAGPTNTPQLGAVLVLADDAASIPLPQLAAHIEDLVATRAVALPMLNRRLEVRPGRWPRWVQVNAVDSAEQFRVRRVGRGEPQSWQGAVQEFFDSWSPMNRPPWHLQLVRDADTGRTALLVAVHHALGDGIAMTDALIRLLVDAPPPVPARPGRDRRQFLAGWPKRLERVRLTLRGLVSLAGATLPPPDGLAGASTTARRYAMAELPAGKVRAVARERGVSTSALLVTVVADALHQVLDGRDGTVAGQRLRAMVPHSTRRSRSGADGGNWTAAMSMELPVGPMPPARRLAEVAAAMARLDRVGQPAATDAVMAVQRLLPARLHARVVRAIARHRFFNLIVSVLPGSRRVHRVAGVPVRAVFPVLSLGTVGVGVGLISWADTIGIGVTADAAVLPDADEFADCFALALDEIAADPARPEEAV